MIPEINLHRFEFHKRFAKGIVLDVGCADGQGWMFPTPQDAVTNPPNIRGISFADCDEWIISWCPEVKVIRCFAENIPLPDKSVDTVCLGDILEHVKDPDKVLQEAKRLTRDRIIVTVPNEWKWPKDDPRILSFHTREYHLSQGKDLRELGFDSTIRHPSGMCKDALDDTQFEHIHHVRFYNENTFKEFIEKNAEGMEYCLFNIKYHELNFVNLAAMMWWKE